MNYNGYFATHVFVCVCLWVCCEFELIRFFYIDMKLIINLLILMRFLVVLSVVATWHAYMLNQVYLKILSGANFDEKSGKQSLNQVCKSY